MKAKNIYIITLLLLVFACTPEKPVIINYSDFKVAKIEMSANHTQLVADDICELELNATLYKEYKYFDASSQEITILSKIPKDRVSENSIKYFLKAGDTPLIGNIFKTKNLSKSEITFYAMADGIRSNDFTVSIRAPFNDSDYLTVKYPVIIHIIESDQTIKAERGLQNSKIISAFERMRYAFNRINVKAPNGADSKIELTLAKYNPQGTLLQDPGIDRVVFPIASLPTNSTLLSNSNLIWDYTKYLNIWILEGGSDRYDFPKVILDDADLNLLKGISFTTVNINNIKSIAVTDVNQIGIILNSRDFAIDDIKYLTYLGKYFGLLPTKSEDYCDDTFPYTFWNNNSSTGNSRLKLYNGLLFFSVNIMDESSACSVISMDQVKRMRYVISKCPTRWAWKSNWAITGKD